MDASARPGNAVRRLALGRLAGQYGIVVSFVVLFVGLSFASPYFLTRLNLINVLRQISINGSDFSTVQGHKTRSK